MNTKKKHKNRPKPNPNPVKVETEVKEEKVEEVLPKSDVKEEIPTDAVDVTAVEATEDIKPAESVEPETDTPKKPKRKGKKKNQDKENVEEDSDKIQESVQEPPKVEKVTSEGESKEQDEGKSSEAASVTPSSRKKKNKKKGQEPVSEPQTLPEIESLPIPVEEKEVEIKKDEPEIKETVPHKAEDTKLDTKSKKKNKKKKRNDSERSDRSEEVTCTSAFQQLLIEDDKPAEETEVQKEDTECKKEKPTTIAENILLEDVPKSCDTEIIESILTAQKPAQDSHAAKESKNKKKNKKDKHSHEETEKKDVSATKPELQQVTTPMMKLLEPSQPEIIKEFSPKPVQTIVEAKQDKELLEPSACEIKREPSPKRKNKKDKHSHEETQKKDVSATKPEINQETTPIMKLMEPSQPEIIKEPSPKPVETVAEAKPNLLELSTCEIKREPSPKRKNKKDKHSHEKTLKKDVSETKPEMKQVTTPIMKLIEPSQPEIIKEPSLKPVQTIAEAKQDKDLLEPSTCEIKREPSPKPKAKIAKPVEKKRKGQADSEKACESPTVLQEDLVSQERPVTPIGIIESKITIEEPKQIESIIELEGVPKTAETMDVPSKTQDKKRKKSERKEEVKEYKTELPKETSSEPSKSEIKTDPGIENVSFTMCDEPIIPLQEPEKLDIVSLVDECPPLLKIDEIDIPDNKTGKRKKKSPKFPLPPEITEPKETREITPDVTEVKETSKTDEPPKSERVSESLAPLSDLEIQSVKTDDSGSSCEATPVVQFTRSASHQLLDTNNNTVIQEVRNVEDVKLNVPIDIPKVEGSGETPLQTPDLVLSGSRKPDKRTSKEEPTYLKSKIMEVNQDMEELRLSLERSLAEFSAMEKSEQKAEDEYEPHRVECEKTFADIEVKKPENPEKITAEPSNVSDAPPVCPARKDNKGKGKSKKKGKQETNPATSSTSTAQSETTSSSSTQDNIKDKEKQEKTEQKTESTEKTKQQSESSKTKQKDDIEEHKTSNTETETTEDFNRLSEQTFSDSLEQLDFAPIDKFEDALTSSIDDVNKSFEMIVKENDEESQKNLAANKPEINITAPVDEAGTSKKETNKRDEKINPVSQPKNFLGQNNIPVQSNRTDYKKEKNKTPNERQARVKIKDATDVEAKKQSKESQTDVKRAKKMVDTSEKETFSRVKNDDEEYVYKYSFRKVFLQSACHVCHKELVQRVPCTYCHLVSYCGAKHKDEDWSQHQALCFAVSTIAHLKDQKHIYADAQNVTGQEYRLLRMQMIVSCEKVLKRRLVPWEQEAMLYPRMCGDVACREWRQDRLKDCEGCGQISYCAENPSHLPKSHQRWCKSYHLYSKLVGYQQTRGRLEPCLPTRVMAEKQLAEKMNEVLAAMYEEKIDMNDIQYAALTQLATAPLTAAFCYQLCSSKLSNCNGLQKKTFTIHVVGAELQFEADALNKWEVFFLHLRPDVQDLRVVLISPVLNPGELPLDLLGKIRLCEHCRLSHRRVLFSFQDKKNYSEYRASDDFVTPKLVCAFNPSIQRSSVFNGKDPWPSTINSIIKQKVPFIITGYTISELRKDIARIKEYSEIDFKVISEPVFNNFASVRPDRNFISDDEMPLLFKNYCVSVLCGC